MSPVLQGHSLIEVQERWTIDDLADWHEAMEIKVEADEFLMKRAQENAGK